METNNRVVLETWYFANNPSLPFAICKILNINDGDKYRFIQRNGEILIEKDGKNYFEK
jgi:hypothetical protein